MELMCPLCGETITVKDEAPFACPRCGGWVRRAAHGRAFMLTAEHRPASPEEAQALEMTMRALEMADPGKKHELLIQAENVCPTCLKTQTELLHLGRLYERNPRKLDYRVIKCYLLHVFEAPEEYDNAERYAVLLELTADPRLERCMELAPIPEDFLHAYALRLCREYIGLFLKGSSRHMKTFMGFQVVRPEKALADPAARMLCAMAQENLPAPFDTLLPACFLEAFGLEVGDDSYLLARKKEIEA